MHNDLKISMTKHDEFEAVNVKTLEENFEFVCWQKMKGGLV